jgi:hypothetical protein
MYWLERHRYVWPLNLTSMLSPRFQAAPVVLLATLLAWKHPSCFLTTFVFTKKAQPARYIHWTDPASLQHELLRHPVQSKTQSV